MVTAAIIVAVALGISFVIFTSGFIYEQGLTKGKQLEKEFQRENHVH